MARRRLNPPAPRHPPPPAPAHSPHFSVIGSAHAQQFYGGLAQQFANRCAAEGHCGFPQTQSAYYQGPSPFGHDSRYAPPYQSYDHRWHKQQRQSNSLFARQRRGEKRKAYNSVDSVVDAVESVTAAWWCQYCNLEVVIDNKVNQVKCPQCLARHLEAPRRPTQGWMSAR